MSDPQRAPGASPDSSQALDQDGSEDKATRGIPDVVASKELQKLRSEAAKYRTERNELRSRLDAVEEMQRAVEAERAKADEARLAEQGEYKQLAEKRAAQIDAAKARIVEAELRSRLSARGVTDARKQALLLPALRSQISADVSDDFAVTGDFDTAIAEIVDVLGLGQAPAPSTTDEPTEPTASPSMNPAALLLSQSMPQGENKAKRGDLIDQMTQALMR